MTCCAGCAGCWNSFGHAVTQSLLRNSCVLGLALAGLAPAGTVFQITASQGDGAQCTATHNPGTKVNLTFACVNPIRGLPSETHRIYNAGSPRPRQTVSQTVQFGDILCMFGVNATANPATFGSLGTVPASAIGYACAVNTRTAGIVTGNVIAASGVIIWP